MKYVDINEIPQQSNHPEMRTSNNFKRQKNFELNDCEEFERFKDFAEDPDLPQHFKYQAASEFLRAAGFESPWFSFFANRPERYSIGASGDEN